MVSYRQTAYNDFETPSGAVGEAPDGPGAFQHVMDQVDGRIGIGGAEYCANAAALSAIGSARVFKGKLAYRADIDTVFRYVGAGNTALGANDSTHWWQGWEKPAAVFTPVWSSGLTVGSSVQTALWGISAGRLWLDLWFQAGSGYALSGEVNLTLPSPATGNQSSGAGYYQPAGQTASGTQFVLQPYIPGTPGTSTNGCRVRAPQILAAAPATPKLVTLSNVLTTAATDQFQMNVSAPSALVA